MSLYTLTEDYLTLLDMASDPDTDEDALRDTLEAVSGEIEDKAEGYAMVIRELESMSKAIDQEMKRMKNRKASIDANIDRMKEALQEAMVLTDKRKFKTKYFSFNIQKNPPSLVIDKGLEDIPEEFLIEQSPKVDTATIKANLKNGIVYDFAHLEQTEGLRIR